MIHKGIDCMNLLIGITNLNDCMNPRFMLITNENDVKLLEIINNNYYNIEQ